MTVSYEFAAEIANAGYRNGWEAALRKVQGMGDRQIGEFLIEELGEPEPTN